MKSRLLKIYWVVLFSILLGAAEAAMVGVLPTTPGGSDWQAYYDEDANLTWLENANPYGNILNFNSANAWVAGLDVNGITGWRLPDTLQPDASCDSQHDPGGGYPLQGIGDNCTGSEMGNLFYNVLGGTAGVSIADSHNGNYDLFSNIRTDWHYWSRTSYAPDSGSAWAFRFGDGEQGYGGISNNFFPWPVHSGNAGAIPTPAAFWCFGSGLFGLIGIGRRRAGN